MPPKTDPKYVMPTPPLGVVHWFSAPGGDPTAAIVTSIGRNAIAVGIVPPDSRGMIPKDGVLHVSDPRARIGNPDNGFWDFTPESKRLAAIEDAARPGK